MTSRDYNLGKINGDYCVTISKYLPLKFLGILIQPFDVKQESLEKKEESLEKLAEKIALPSPKGLNLQLGKDDTFNSFFNQRKNKFPVNLVSPMEISNFLSYFKKFSSE